jgi:hypothetical protein
MSGGRGLAELQRTITLEENAGWFGYQTRPLNNEAAYTISCA